MTDGAAGVAGDGAGLVVVGPAVRAGIVAVEMTLAVTVTLTRAAAEPQPAMPALTTNTHTSRLTVRTA